MKKNELSAEIAAVAGIDKGELRALLVAISSSLAELALEGDSVAIPGFGVFYPVKTDEQICLNEDGSKTMLPPNISLQFRPSVILRKNLE